MRHLPALVVAIGFLFAATPAFAQSTAEPDPADETKKDEPKDHTAYVSISPLHLIFPIVELTGEFRLHRQIGVAAIAGYGSIDPKSVTVDPNLKPSRFTVWELGGQFVGYPVGHFDHGMQLGAELLYAGVSGEAQSGNTRISGAAQGLAVGPFVGYKFTAPIGFSFNVQGGFEYIVAQASGTTASEIIPLINLNLGWAF